MYAGLLPNLDLNTSQGAKNETVTPILMCCLYAIE